MHRGMACKKRGDLDVVDVEMTEESPEARERNRLLAMERLRNVYTQEEMEEFLEAFSLFDRDHNGRITADEMGTVMRALGQHPTQSQLYEMIGRIDKDRNGMIEFPEFMILMSQKKKATFYDNPEYLRKCFQIFDKNNDTYITACELRNIMTNLGEKLSDAEVDEMIRVADIDGDGRLNYNEFIALMYND